MSLRIVCLKILLVSSLVYLSIACVDRSPIGLFCELLTNPGALITNSEPALGWIVNDSRKGAKQTAYHILVASSKENLKRNFGDLWDSGKILSNQSQNVIYAGKPLQENQSYFWKVKVWDSKGKNSGFSEFQLFHTGNFGEIDRKWPGESKWNKISIDGKEKWVYENRHPIDYQLLMPEVIQKNEQGYFVDFGKAVFATLQLTLNTPLEMPVEIEVRLGEKMIKPFSVDTQPGASINYKSVVFTINKGETIHVVQLPRQRSNYPNSQNLVDHMPEVTPFRYAEIFGWPEPLVKENVQQKALFYQFDDNASFFHSSNESLNKIWDLCKHTLKATPFLGIYSDGTRERMPYEADAYIQQLGHYSVDREYAISRYTHEFLIFNPSWPTEWILHSVLMAWADYLYTGNAQSLKRYYSELKHKTLIDLARHDGLLNTDPDNMSDDLMERIHFKNQALHSTRNRIEDIVDWPHGPKPENPQSFWSTVEGGEIDHFDFKPVNTVVNSFHYRNLVLMGKISKVVGKVNDAEYYIQSATHHRNAFNKVFFDSSKGYYVDGEGSNHSSLHANMFALAFGLVPEESKNTVIDFIKSRGMACSPYGAQYLLECLYDNGEDEYALDLMVNETDRGWINMIRIGSTMTTEAWDIKYKPNFDWNHAWGSAPANIIIRKMMGIEPLEPGFQKISIKPQLYALEHAEVKVPSPAGAIFLKWKKNLQGKKMDITIPANSSAVLYLKSMVITDIKENGRSIKDHQLIKYLGTEGQYVLLEVPSGCFSFSIP